MSSNCLKKSVLRMRRPCWKNALQKLQAAERLRRSSNKMYQTYQASGKELGSPLIRSKLHQMQRGQDWGISYAQRRRDGHLKHVVLRALIKKVVCIRRQSALGYRGHQRRILLSGVTNESKTGPFSVAPEPELVQQANYSGSSLGFMKQRMGRANDTWHKTASFLMTPNARIK